jgi:DNA-binding NtrC family response regulator
LSDNGKPIVLVVEDEEAMRYSFRRMMAKEPFDLETCSSGQEALARIAEGGVSVVVLDVRLGGEIDGHETQRRIKEIDPRISVILMTAYASANTAIEATRHGAYDYILKPFEADTMRELIDRAYQAHQAMTSAVHFGDDESAELPDSGDCIVGLSPAMQAVYKKIGRVANAAEPVLIRGESGTGKELVARAIYQFSKRKDALFLPLNCAAIPETLLESEFFGHEKGSFTGAHERRIGKFEQADGGTVFLDEIGEMPLETQVKLLRFLEDKVVTRVGAARGQGVDVRILAATNRPLEKMVAEGTFREDLYYRLNVVSIQLPELSERRQDIPLLARYFLTKYAKANGIDPPAILPAAIEAMERYDWPGNVRELENTIRRALVDCRGHAITPADLGLGNAIAPAPTPPSGVKAENRLEELLADRLLVAREELTSRGDCDPVLPQLEEILVRQALDLTEGNQVQASKILGIARNTLRKRLLSLKETVQIH